MLCLQYTSRHRLAFVGRAISAGAWNLGALVTSQVMRLGGNLVMTRLLMPEMFGIISIAATVLFILHLLSDVGLRQNILQSPRGDDPVVSQYPLDRADRARLCAVRLDAVSRRRCLVLRKPSISGRTTPPTPHRNCRWCWPGPVLPRSSTGSSRRKSTWPFALSSKRKW